MFLVPGTITRVLLGQTCKNIMRLVDDHFHFTDEKSERWEEEKEAEFEPQLTVSLEFLMP